MTYNKYRMLIYIKKINNLHNKKLSTFIIFVKFKWLLPNVLMKYKDCIAYFLNNLFNYELEILLQYLGSFAAFLATQLFFQPQSK